MIFFIFLVCSVSDKIVSANAQHVHAIIFENYSKSQIKMQISTIKNSNFEKPLGTHLLGTKWTFWRKKFFSDISPNKFGSPYAQSPRKCSNLKILAKIDGKEANFFPKIYQGHIRILFGSKKIQNYLMLVYL